MIGRHHATALLAVLLLALVGMTSAQAAGNGTAPMLTAATTALAAAQPGTRVIGIESEHDGAYWEVKLATADGKRSWWNVSADGKNIEGGPYTASQSARNQRKWQHRMQTAKLDYEQAHAAIIQARDGQVTELDLDDEDDVIVWDANVETNGKEYDVRINARTGHVMKNERD